MAGFSLSLTLLVASLSCVGMGSFSVTLLVLLPCLLCFADQAASLSRESSAIVMIIN